MSQNEDMGMTEYELLYLLKDAAATYEGLMEAMGLDSATIGGVRRYLEGLIDERYGSLTLELTD